MTDITALKQKLEQDLEPLLKERNAANEQYGAYTAQLAPIEDRLKQMHGFSRLKKPFIKATKVASLHRKQKKLTERITKQDVQIAKTINGIFGDLGGVLIQDTTMGESFKYLRDTFDAVESTKHTVLRAAKICRHASTTEMFGGDGNDMSRSDEKNIIIDLAISAVVQLNAKRAAKAVRGAQAELQSLQTKLKEAPQISSYLADDISRQSSFAFAMDAFGGFMSSWSNWDVSRDLQRAKTHLREASTHLDEIADSLVNDELSLLMTVAARARETNPYIGQLLSSLGTYIPPNKAPAQVKQNNAKPQQP